MISELERVSVFTSSASPSSTRPKSRPTSAACGCCCGPRFSPAACIILSIFWQIFCLHQQPKSQIGSTMNTCMGSSMLPCRQRMLQPHSVSQACHRHRAVRVVSLLQYFGKGKDGRMPGRIDCCCAEIFLGVSASVDIGPVSRHSVWGDLSPPQGSPCLFSHSTSFTKR